MRTASADDLACELVDRKDLLEAIAGRPPIAAKELAEELGKSVSTINRVVGSFARDRLVERTNDGIAITPSGAILLQSVQQFVETVETARTLHPVLTALADAPIAYEVEWLLEATVTASTPKHPYAPLNRYSELFATAEHKRLIGDRFVVPKHGVTAAMRAMDDGVLCSCVWSERAMTRLAEEYPEVVDWSAGKDDLEAAISETVPLDLAILDDHLLVYGFDENGVMTVLADTDDPAAVDWGTSLFEACFEDGATVEL